VVLVIVVGRITDDRAGGIVVMLAHEIVRRDVQPRQHLEACHPEHARDHGHPRARDGCAVNAIGSHAPHGVRMIRTEGTIWPGRRIAPCARNRRAPRSRRVLHVATPTRRAHGAFRPALSRQAATFPPLRAVSRGLVHWIVNDTVPSCAPAYCGAAPVARLPRSFCLAARRDIPGRARSRATLFTGS
jgi:hypothetical protein